MSAHPQRFPVGTKYTPRGKASAVCTVTDFLTTTNLAGKIVRTCYTSEHLFCGQTVYSFDVCDATIARGEPVLPS